jgi:uncharacterized RDD family membrane protein YckC
MGMEWFYANGGNRLGPVTPVAFEGLVKDGVVNAETLVWTKGMAEWTAYGKVAGDTAVCAASGGRHWQKDMVPYEGKFISAEHKEQYFQRLREGVVQPGQLVYAEFGTRFAAKLLDGVIGWVAGAIINFGLAFVFFGQFIFQPKPNNPVVAGKFLAYQGSSMLLGVAFGVTYSWFFLKNYAATPGKMALGIKVVRSDGSPLSTGRIIGRYFSELLSTMILMIGYIMAGFDDERRALHDRICDTRVIKSR